jgi:threonine dehydrogenase-like Zn-dependent dehydrogenase
MFFIPTDLIVTTILGAGKVIGTVGNETKKKIALKAGADHVICYKEEDFVHKVNELTNGEGADVILDSISGTVSERSLQCLAPCPFWKCKRGYRNISNKRFTCKLPIYSRI